MLLVVPPEASLAPVKLQLGAQQTVHGGLSRGRVIIFTSALLIGRRSRLCLHDRMWLLVNLFGLTRRCNVHNFIGRVVAVFDKVLIASAVVKQVVLSATIVRCDEEALGAFSFV